MTASSAPLTKPPGRLGQAARGFAGLLAAIEWPRLHPARPHLHPGRTLSDHLLRDLGLRADGEGL